LKLTIKSVDELLEEEVWQMINSGEDEQKELGESIEKILKRFLKCSKTIPRTALDQKLDEFEKDFGNYEAFKKARETLNNN
jgi:negative regulator of replication initiation